MSRAVRNQISKVGVNIILATILDLVRVLQFFRTAVGRTKRVAKDGKRTNRFPLHVVGISRERSTAGNPR